MLYSKAMLMTPNHPATKTEGTQTAALKQLPQQKALLQNPLLIMPSENKPVSFPMIGSVGESTG